MLQRLNWNIFETDPDSVSPSSSNVSLPSTVLLPSPATLGYHPDVDGVSLTPKLLDSFEESQTQESAADVQPDVPTSQSTGCSPVLVSPKEHQGPEHLDPLQMKECADGTHYALQKTQSMPLMETCAWRMPVRAVFEPRRTSREEAFSDSLEDTLISTTEDGSKHPNASSSDASAWSAVKMHARSGDSGAKSSLLVPLQSSCLPLGQIEDVRSGDSASQGSLAVPLRSRCSSLEEIENVTSSNSVPDNCLPFKGRYSGLDPMELWLQDPMRIRPLDPVEIRFLDPIEVRPLDPLEIRPLVSMEIPPLEPLEMRPLDPIEIRPLDPTEDALPNNGVSWRKQAAPKPALRENGNSSRLDNNVSAGSSDGFLTGLSAHSSSVPVLSLSSAQGLSMTVARSPREIASRTDVFLVPLFCCYCRKKLASQSEKMKHEKICAGEMMRAQSTSLPVHPARPTTSPNSALCTPVLEGRKANGPVTSACSTSTRRQRISSAQTRSEIISSRPTPQPSRVAKKPADPSQRPRFGTYSEAKPLLNVPNPTLNRSNSPNDVSMRLLAQWRSAGLIQRVSTKDHRNIVEEALGKSTMVPLAVWKIADTYEGQPRIDGQCYDILKESMIKRDGEANERMLWHGTRWNTVLNVIKSGFNRSYATQRSGKRTFGFATYFTPKADYANLYADKDSNLKGILLAKVLVGNACRGSVDDKEPPLRPDGKFHYDSTFDEAHNTTRIAIFKDYQAVPLYLVVFGPSR